jgi:hypothetical protein
MYISEGAEIRSYNVNGARMPDLIPPQVQPDDFFGIAADGAGNVYVADESDLVKLDRLGNKLGTFPLPLANLASLVTLDASGNVYVSGQGSGAIVKVSPTGSVLDTYHIPAGDKPAWISGLDVDPAGNLYADDSNNQRILRMQPGPAGSGTLTVTTLATGFLEPSSVAFNPKSGELLAFSNDGATAGLVRLNPVTGTVLGKIRTRAGVSAVRADAYGSVYAVVMASDPSYVHGIDPTISSNDLYTQMRSLVDGGVALDGTANGEFFKGLAARAARTRNNLASLKAAHQQLQSLRNEVRTSTEPEVGQSAANTASQTIEKLDGYLTSLEMQSPLVVGENPVGGGPSQPADQENPLWAAIWMLIGGEPYYGRYISPTPIAFPLPAHVDLTLDSTTATSSFLRPGIWRGETLVRPTVISSTLSADFSGLVGTVTQFSSEFGPFDINGTSSGNNHSHLAPNGQVFSAIDALHRTFEAHAEGWITNDLYPDSRPIFSFTDLQGYLAKDGKTAASYGTNEPIIVPGLPGGPPTSQPGVAFIATRVSFDHTTNTLHFLENTDTSRSPDVSVILTPDGVFAAGVGSGEPLIGCAFNLSPLVFTGLDPVTGRYLLADSTFTITGSDGTFASGELTGIFLDPATLDFAATVHLDPLGTGPSSPFVEILRADGASILLLTPSDTLALLDLTKNFTVDGTSDTGLLTLGVVPEPGAVGLVATTGLFLIGRRRQRYS